MKVSQKTEYALRAMLELASYSERHHAVRSADIAHSQEIPEKFLELILVELRRAGLLISQRGPVGGHRLARDPALISVGEIWRAIDGANERESRRAVDPFRAVWEDVDKAISNVVDRISLAEVRKRAEAKRGVPDYSI